MASNFFNKKFSLNYLMPVIQFLHMINNMFSLTYGASPAVYYYYYYIDHMEELGLQPNVQGYVERPHIEASVQPYLSMEGMDIFKINDDYEDYYYLFYSIIFNCFSQMHFKIMQSNFVTLV